MANYCEYCGSLLPTGAAACPACGAPVDPGRKGVPKTIDELKAFAAWHRLPLKDMRFFLGEDYRGPRAFGIYQEDGGDFVVYKNKADGSRAIRYRGSDEAYAVNELYLKMKAEIINQRKAQSARAASGKNSARKSASGNRTLLRPLIFCLALAAAITVFRTANALKNKNGYYHYNNNYYYSQQDDWYRYDDELDYWFPVTVEEELSDNAADYYESSYYAANYGVSDFSDSEYYEESSSSWDDDSDWDWDSSSDWDSGSTDWDSDW